MSRPKKRSAPDINGSMEEVDVFGGSDTSVSFVTLSFSFPTHGLVESESNVAKHHSSSNCLASFHWFGTGHACKDLEFEAVLELPKSSKLGAKAC
ncbi:hypothetical protein Tco_0573013 [Tanacetum coccineum]